MRSLKIQKPVGGEFPGSIWIFIFSVEKAKKLEFSVSGGKHNWVSEIWECKEALRRDCLVLSRGRLPRVEKRFTCLQVGEWGDSLQQPRSVF